MYNYFTALAPSGYLPIKSCSPTFAITTFTEIMSFRVCGWNWMAVQSHVWSVSV